MVVSAVTMVTASSVRCYSTVGAVRSKGGGGGGDEGGGRDNKGDVGGADIESEVKAEEEEVKAEAEVKAEEEADSEVKTDM